MRWIGLAIVTLYVVSIPWYREPGAVPAVILGLPDWVAVAVGAYVLIATLTAVAWLRTPIDDGDDDPSLDRGGHVIHRDGGGRE